MLYFFRTTILQESAISQESAILIESRIKYICLVKNTVSMNNKTKRSKAWNISLWAVQLLLTTLFCWAGAVKLFSPPGELAAMWPWTAEHPQLVILTGIVDLLGGVGFIVPSLLRIKPRLTIYAALGAILLMIIASMFHIVRGEANGIVFNVLVAAMAAFIAWGRSRIWPVPGRQLLTQPT
jgi:hypothetical protein